MGPKELRGRLLLVLGASGIVSAATLAACGSTSSTPPKDAGSESGSDTGLGGGDDASGDDAFGDDSSSAQDVNHDVDPDAIPTVRRPFLVGSSLRSASAATRDDWATETPPIDITDALTKRRLAAAWLDDALQEHASVAAFSRFAMQLLGVGAPPSLVQGALRASIDEIAHAKACFALARRYGAEQHGPSALVVHDAVAELDLAALVALNVEEGCIGETLGVVLAAEQLARATDPHVRSVLERIVRDETRHAELAWRFVAWAIGEDARMREVALSAAARAIASARAIAIRPNGADAATWAAHGRLSCALARAVVEHAIRDVLHPCLAALATPACYHDEPWDRRSAESRLS
jgi:hypothetical protein